MNRPFLIDVDGVCIDWLDPFLLYMKRIGHVPEPGVTDYDLRKRFPKHPDVPNAIACFTHTMDYLNLEPIRGAVDGMFLLKERFPESLMVAVTCCGTDDFATKGRRFQLRHMPFDAMIALPLGAAKARVFHQLASGVVIDDHERHTEEAIIAGHQALLFDQPWNRDALGLRVHGWPGVLEFFA